MEMRCAGISIRLSSPPLVVFVYSHLLSATIYYEGSLNTPTVLQYHLDIIIHTATQFLGRLTKFVSLLLLVIDRR